MEGNKRLKSEENDDYISPLPDDIIHHILSFLPSTKMAIRTGVLSKRWLKQWTHVPVLFFDSADMSYGKFTSSVANTIALHERLKIEKFHMKFYSVKEDPHFDAKIIHFALNRQVKEMIMEFNNCNEEFELPEFFFDHAHLVNLQAYNCAFSSAGKVNWLSLKKLDITSCWLSDEKVKNILSGCLLLEFLEINRCYGLTNPAIASESLKVLNLEDLDISNAEISCPKLVELRLELTGVSLENIRHVMSCSSVLESFVLEVDRLENLVIASESLKLLTLINLKMVSLEISCPNLVDLRVDQSSIPDGATEHVLSHSPVLESLELFCCEGFHKLVIASNSLKRLVLAECEEFDQLVITSNSLETLVLQILEISSVIEISCPGVEKLKVSKSLYVKTFKLSNTASMIRATLDFESRSEESGEDFAKQILEELHHAKEVIMGSQFIKILSALEEGGMSPPLVNNKCLILNGADFQKHPAGIAFALGSSPVLENLVIEMSIHEIDLHDPETTSLPELNDIEDNYWMSMGTAVSSLKTVDIINLSKRDAKCKNLINFLGFILKSGRVLEKMEVIVDGDKDIATEISEKLLSFPKCSEHAEIKLLTFEVLL